MVTVDASRVRNRLKDITSQDIADTYVNIFIDDALAFLSEWRGKTLSKDNLTALEAALTTDLATLYCIVYLTGGNILSGLKYKLGPLTIETDEDIIKITNFLRSRVEENLKLYPRTFMYRMVNPE